MTEPMSAEGGAPAAGGSSLRAAEPPGALPSFHLTLPMLTKIFTSDLGRTSRSESTSSRRFDIPNREHWNYPSLGMENGSGGESGRGGAYLVYTAAGEYGVSLLRRGGGLRVLTFPLPGHGARGAHPSSRSLPSSRSRGSFGSGSSPGRRSSHTCSPP